MKLDRNVFVVTEEQLSLKLRDVQRPGAENVLTSYVNDCSTHLTPY